MVDLIKEALHTGSVMLLAGILFLGILLAIAGFVWALIHCAKLLDQSGEENGED